MLRLMILETTLTSYWGYVYSVQGQLYKLNDALISRQ